MATTVACMQAHYTEASDRSGTDLLVIKERIRDDQGNEKSNLRFIENFKRMFYITKKGYRATHTTKKEYETLENLDAYTSTQSKLASSIAKVLGERGGYPKMSDLKKSPYLYGTDISTTSLVRKQYADRYPMYQPNAIVATLDLETNVFSDRGEIIYGCVTCKDKAILAVTKEFIGDIPNPEAQLLEMFEALLGKYKLERKMTLHVRVADDDYGVVRTLFGSLHKIQPDFVSIWNMSFDINKIIDCLEYHNVDPKYIFSDPKVPEIYKKFRWREGQMQKTTATGKVTSKHVADLWHVVDAPASFYIIDAMCFFKQSRVRERARHSYSLDAILREELNLSKLKFKEADHLSGLEWHQFMQRNFKIHYGIYNVFDCIALELLDEHTKDISRAVLSGLGISDPANLPSGPKRLSNDLHVERLEHGAVIAATSPDMTEPLDKLVLPMTNWIVTAASELSIGKGQPIISDMEGMATRIYTHAIDVDIESGYPVTGIIMNVGKETTLREVCGIEGMTTDEQRRVGVNITAVPSNAIDLGKSLYGLPSLETLRKEFLAAI